MREIYSKLTTTTTTKTTPTTKTTTTTKTPERRHSCRSGIFIVNSEQILHIILVFPLLTLNKKKPPELTLLGYILVILR